MNRRTFDIVVAISAITISGCAPYVAKPLDGESVEQRLAIPDSNHLRIAASELKHPYIQPIDLDLDHGVSPDEAGVLAVLINPALRAARDQRALASAQLLQAGLLPNPQLAASIDLPQGSASPDNHTAYSIGPSWDITALIARGNRRSSARAAAQSVDLNIAWQEWQTAQAATTAAYDLLSLKQQLGDAKLAEASLTENLDVVQRAVDQHQKTLLELVAAESALRDAQAIVLAQEKDLRHQRLVLNRALGLPPEYQLALRGVELPSSLTPPPIQELLTDLENRRLDLVALRKGYDSQDATLRAAILGQFPRINLGFNSARDTTAIRTLGVGVTIDIPIFDRNQGVIATEIATRQRLFDEYATRIFTARSDIATAVEDIDAINKQIAAGAERIASLDRVVRTYDAAVQRGDIDILSVYTARTTLIQKRVEQSKLKQQLMLNWIALQIASGRHLELPATPPTTEPAP